MKFIKENVEKALIPALKKYCIDYSIVPYISEVEKLSFNVGQFLINVYMSEICSSITGVIISISNETEKNLVSTKLLFDEFEIREIKEVAIYSHKVYTVLTLKNSYNEINLILEEK